MKFTLSFLEKRPADSEKIWPAYMLGGRVRTSTLVLIVAFFAVLWTYDHYRPQEASKPPAPQVVPPGFVPDPNYTWVPRTKVQQPQPSVTYTPTPTTTTPPPFQLPQLPCLLPAPFCPASSTPATPPPQAPQPGPGPTPTSLPPAS